MYCNRWLFIMILFLYLINMVMTQYGSVDIIFIEHQNCRMGCFTQFWPPSTVYHLPAYIRFCNPLFICNTYHDNPRDGDPDIF